MHANKQWNINFTLHIKDIDNQPTEADHLGVLKGAYLISKFALPALPSDNSRMWLTLTG